MKKTYKYIFIIIFLILPFLFINEVSALEYEATVVNPEGAKCSLRSDSTGLCFYKDTSFNSVTQGVLWLDNGDKVTVITGYDAESPDKNLCPGNYVYVKYNSLKYGEKYGYYCNTYLQSGSFLTDELREEFAEAGFPESYFDSLAYLKTVHPNWNFRAINTGLDWNTVISAESSVGTSFIQGSEEGYRSTLGGSYNYYTDTFTVMEGSSWYAANSEVVAYYMDPRNFLKDMYIFQFESLEYNGPKENVEEDIDENENLEESENEDTTEVPVEDITEDNQLLTGVQKILDGNYLCDYAADFVTAASSSGVSSLYLASLALQEVGGGTIATSGEGFYYSSSNTKYSSLCGQWINGGYYNVYNIGAGTDTSPAQNSVVYAMGGADGTATTYGRPWNTMSKAIIGGASFIGETYITKGQYTIYLKKFNVVSTYWDLYSHQYQTNIRAVASEATTIYRAYSELGILDSEFVFSIPVYKNMPDSTSLPNKGNPNNYLKTLQIGTFDEEKVTYTDVNGFDGATDGYTVYVSYDVSKVDILGTTVNSNASISNLGTKNLEVGENIFEIVVTAQNEDTKTYTLKIIRIENESSEPTVDEIVADSGIKSDGTYFSGISIDTKTNTLVDKIKSLNANATVVVKDDDGTEKRTESLATGDTVAITSAGDTKIFTIVIFGDTSGDGVVNSLDLLKVQKHILEVTTLNGPYLKAADSSKDGTVNPLDLLKVQKHILGVSLIEQ